MLASDLKDRKGCELYNDDVIEKSLVMEFIDEVRDEIGQLVNFIDNDRKIESIKSLLIRMDDKLNPNYY